MLSYSGISLSWYYGRVSFNLFSAGIRRIWWSNTASTDLQPYAVVRRCASGERKMVNPVGTLRGAINTPVYLYDSISNFHHRSGG